MPLRSQPRLTRGIVPGVHRLQHAYVNCYFIEDEDGVTIVDAAHPATWRHVEPALEAIGRSSAEVQGIVLTHAHFDHLGFALRARREWGVPVYGHPLEAYIAEHPYRYAHENPRLLYPLQHPKALVPLTAMARAGALNVEGITDLIEVTPGGTLDLPGQPVVVFSPGHTYGHCALHLPQVSALLCGDALVTFNPYTAGTGPQIVSGAATADSAEALRSLDALAATGARVVLPGHGEAWRAGIQSAVDAARLAGPS